jgi:hypothetical protein
VTDGDARLVGEVLEKIGRFAVSMKFGIEVPSPSIEFEEEKSIETMKDRGLAIQAAAYPLASMLKSGIPVDIREYCESTGIPLNKEGTLDPTYLANLKILTEIGVTGGGPPNNQQMSRTPEITEQPKLKYRTFAEEDFEANAFTYVPR